MPKSKFYAPIVVMSTLSMNSLIFVLNLAFFINLRVLTPLNKMVLRNANIVILLTFLLLSLVIRLCLYLIGLMPLTPRSILLIVFLPLIVPLFLHGKLSFTLPPIILFLNLLGVLAFPY